ncbi:phenazine biosynthesis protein, partial [Listeria monocytogenes]|nr:phenazine biosynthesis protein [Listeria monocytogenes]
LSARGGFLECTLADERVIIGGKGVLYAKGTCFL